MIYYDINTIFFWHGVVVALFVLWVVTSVMMAVMKRKMKKLDKEVSQ